jgi:hypothetical protein
MMDTAQKIRAAGAQSQTAQTNILPKHYTTFSPPDYDGYLTDDQLADLGRLHVALHKIGEMIDRVNFLAAATNLPLRAIPTFHAILMSNDISVLHFAHKQAVQRIQAEAMERLEVAA